MILRFLLRRNLKPSMMYLSSGIKKDVKKVNMLG